ncbi:protein artichoke-like [Cydia pomonella]|uniref:protein artichoke-like n=1 Tax=Cydia pomonella TaxID=82600 RepID=UPI002ADDB3C0|nr:protein artichoke-like [Cydia pomonella]
MDNAKLILATLFLLTAQSVTGDCNFTKEMETPEECIGFYECSETVGDLTEVVKDWDCVRVEQRLYCDNNGHICQYMNRPLDNYWLKIKVVNTSDNIDDIHRNIYGLSQHILTMTLKNGNTTFIPNELYNLPKLSSLDISHNKINSINLLLSLKMENLIIFNASFNIISELEKVSFESYKTGSNITIIDLSHNAITIIPDNYFSKFSNLLHLNISYNNINSFTVLTFEGLTQLETLYLSYNNIKTVDINLARFSNLKELTLDNNDLSSLEENNFKMLSNLIKLNLSFNKIFFIDDFSFRKMINLQSLQLNSNNITMISKSMFIDNAALQQVDISNNQIHTIDPFSFRGTNITQCNFRNNALTMLNDKSIFYGIKVKELDLSVSNIITLGENIFIELHPELLKLNLSFDCITHIHENSFRYLALLTELDLSNNKLLDLDFDMSDLKSLTSFNVENNQIREITKTSFRRLKSLFKVNLSKNSIEEIEIFSFHDLEAVRVLDLSNNSLPGVIAPYTFQGLSLTFELRLMHSKLTSLQDAAFFGMTALTVLNASYGDVKVLEYNVFNGTNIWTLDLSHNCLEMFKVNNSYLKYMAVIYLNDNKIENVSNDTFHGLTNLLKINLDDNYILQITVGAFSSLHKLSSLHISSNPDMILDASVFSNMALRDVNLQNIWKPFSFSNARNVSMQKLDLSFSNITKANSIMIYKIKNIETLLLTSNHIRYVDRYSFQNLSSLTFLDLSNNMISTIQAGSFTGTRALSILNLCNNNLVSLIFGVFDGLPALQVLNLTSNALKSFQGRLFHNSHKLSIISLDDNMIEDIDFHEVKEAAIRKITIGGNLIPCDCLVKAKKYNFDGVTVTSEKLNFHVENVDGISCKGSQMDSKTDYQQFDSGNIKEIVKNHTHTEEGQFLGMTNLKNINYQLDALKSAIYFEASCLLIIVCLLLGIVSFVYVKFRSKLIKTYNLSSRRRLTESTVEMEL